MKYIKSIFFAALFFIPALCFSQSKVEQITNLFKQDSSKPKSTGTQSNLAVSDEGKGGGKTQTNKTASSSDKPKQQDSSKTKSTVKQSNLAVSDEGKGGAKGKSSATKEAIGTDTVKGKEIKKEETKTAEPKK